MNSIFPKEIGALVPDVGLIVEVTVASRFPVASLGMGVSALAGVRVKVNVSPAWKLRPVIFFTTEAPMIL